MKDTDFNAEWTAESRLLDYRHPRIAALITQRGWRDLPESAAIAAVHDFVRDEILFGYNARDDIPASQVLGEGYGQCNTKATLFMALLRGIGLPCRLHGFTIHKALQRGVVPELAYKITPDDIVHSWVEVLTEGRWRQLEGFIVDATMLGVLRTRFAGRAALCGYGVGTCDLHGEMSPGDSDTYVQSTAINRDFGIFTTPDAFYARHAQSFGWLRQWLFDHVVRHWMNARVARMRRGWVPDLPLHEHADRDHFDPDKARRDVVA